MEVLLDSKRCFECGATYKSEVLTCQLDGTPLSSERISRRWKVEGLLGRRRGGGVFSAFHLGSGARAAIDVVPWPLTEDPEIGGRLYGEVQALRALEKLPHVPRLLETGTDRDGSRFVITDLGQARPLRDLVQGALPPPRATQLLHPVLSLLGMAHRLGIYHGEIGAGSIYVGPLPSGPGGRGAGAEEVRLHGLFLQPREAGRPPAPVTLMQVQEDLRGIAGLLHELLCGTSRDQAGPGRVTLLGARMASLLDRAILGDPQSGFKHVEEFARALHLLAPPSMPVHIDLPRVSVLLPAMTSSRLMTAVSGATQQTAALPPPLSPLTGAIPKAGLTHELRQISVVDLMQEPERQKVTHETLAVSRNRPFTTGEMEAAAAAQQQAAEAEDAALEADLEVETEQAPQVAPQVLEAAPEVAPVVTLSAEPPWPSVEAPSPPDLDSAVTPARMSAATPLPSSRISAGVPPSRNSGLPLLASALQKSGLTPSPSTDSMPQPLFMSTMTPAAGMMPPMVIIQQPPQEQRAERQEQPWGYLIFWGGVGVFCAALLSLLMILLVGRR